MISLQELIGTHIVAYVPMFHETDWVKLKLLNVETGGIWVESQEVLEEAMRGCGVTVAPKTAIFFLPFAQIRFVLASLDVPSISDEALR